MKVRDDAGGHHWRTYSHEREKNITLTKGCWLNCGNTQYIYTNDRTQRLCRRKAAYEAGDSFVESTRSSMVHYHYVYIENYARFYMLRFPNFFCKDEKRLQYKGLLRIVASEQQWGRCHVPSLCSLWWGKDRHSMNMTRYLFRIRGCTEHRFIFPFRFLLTRLRVTKKY